MDVQKLMTAAASIKDRFPEYSKELVKIAQEIAQDTTGLIADMGQPSLTNETGGALNPNIKSFAPNSQVNNRKIHTVTFKVEVPDTMGELEIMERLNKELSSMRQENPDIAFRELQVKSS